VTGTKLIGLVPKRWSFSNQEVILLEAPHRLALIEGQKEMVRRLEAVQEKWRKHE